ncbi:MAG: DNA methyltransferase [Bacteroidetes bacterium]|nr:DNA methyltransferase [Bacteroidota bacterium]
MIKKYLRNILKITFRGDAREESYYSTLSGLLDDFAQSIGKSDTQITTLPKKTDAGNPDFRVWDGTQNIVGYIEAKKPGENLDSIEEKGQLKRYRSTFPNLILTDFFEFRLYRHGELIDRTFIARSNLAKKGIAPPVENEEKFQALLHKFFGFSLPQVRTAEELARELANRTRFLRDEVISLEMEQQQQGKGELYGFYETFRKYLIANLKEQDFADLFSQTITYGMFAARTRSSNGFNRKLAYDLIPKTIGILRNVFRFVSQGDLPRNMEVMIDDIAEVLNAADVKNILQQYYRAGRGEDPIVHFYETFLNAYDPSTREKRGVYYTPEPVVRYIVRSVHKILKTHFDLNDGLASREVTLLDPAGGTLTFPAEAIKLAVQEYKDKYGAGGVRKLISEHILKNFHAFELMMAPYAIGHIKISFLLEELGYTMKDNERFRLFLTNTLDMEDLQQTRIPGLESLSDESHEAGKLKKSEPILVIMGNPPYSGHSANKNDWTEKLLKESLDGALNYYEVDGQPLGEKNPKWLQDDYVKFLRFAQWKIHKAGRGIVAMITNHSYLNNPTFRGMRQSLMNTYNEIFILDLHGNSLKKETTPDGGKDVNVFDIQQGVSIAIMVKVKNKKGCKVYVHDIYGLREDKYKWLETRELAKKNYTLINPQKPFHFFKNINTIGLDRYIKWPGVQEIFPVNSVGIVTARDNLTIKWSPIEVLNTIRQFASMDPELARQTYNLGKDTRDWKVKLAQEDLKKSGLVPEHVQPISYRPFDVRFTYYTGVSRGYLCMPRPEVMNNLIKENLSLNAVRQVKTSKWQHALVSDQITESCFVSNKTSEIDYVFPLYLYKPSEEKKKKQGFQTMMLFEPEEEYGKEGRKPNISSKVFEMLEKTYQKRPSPEQIMYYCYGVLYSNTYRERYAEFLKIDFPRIPFTSDHKLFLKMAEISEELAQLHLLKSKVLHNAIARYWGQGEDIIEKPIYDEENKRVYINKEKYFEGISKEVWEYHIGGYQVAKKYLDWRKGRQVDDQKYCQIITAISKTIELQENIDHIYKNIEEKIITF